MAAVANANAIGATNVAKVASNKSGGFVDPMVGYAMVAMGLVIAFIMMSVRVQTVPTAPATSLKKELQDFCSESAGNCATAQPVYGNRNGI
jgi:tetrahydromethanopterin S-methyltransferase subunit C